MIDDFLNILSSLTVAFAVLAAIAGIAVLVRFFHNKIRDLFSDTNYFIFFFLVVGYILSSLGEFTYYLTAVMYQDPSLSGIADVYWVGGSISVLASFIVLAVILSGQERSRSKSISMLIFGAAVISLTVFLLFLIREPDASFFRYFYPIVTSLIVASAFSVVLYPKPLGEFRQVLLLFFMASSSLLLSDLLFSTFTELGGLGTADIVMYIFYLVGYALSFTAFTVMLVKVRRLVNT